MPRLLIFVSTAAENLGRRQAIRNSWMRYLPELADDVEVTFLASRSKELEQEQENTGDLSLVNAPEGYHNLWNKALVFLRQLVAQRSGTDVPHYVLHVDDDSFVRLDLLVPEVSTWPQERFYYGYIWDSTGNRQTRPIRNPSNKSYMPKSQYSLDYYPPFASGCGFVLSWDLVRSLTAHSLPDYRLLDPPFGIHLCGPPEMCVLPTPVVPVHDERIRPYKPLPTFRPDTLIQHYLTPEEMRPYYLQALEHKARRHSGTPLGVNPESVGRAGMNGSWEEDAPQALYEQLVRLGLLRR